MLLHIKHRSNVHDVVLPDDAATLGDLCREAKSQIADELEASSIKIVVPKQARGWHPHREDHVTLAQAGAALASCLGDGGTPSGCSRHAGHVLRNVPLAINADLS